ncbi:MAG TPA: roadblock/LC7 domain-containing protein [Candidatus Stackebrandtia faecavium]|nr:roadblock/LC7 domain-containing protein [Candidatus Stackebrandtia faecavium]
MQSDNMNYLLNDFVDRVPDVTHVLTVSSDGLLIACNDDLPQEDADRLAAIASGLVSLLAGAAKALQADPVISCMAEMYGGYMFSMTISGGASLLALASYDCDIGQVGHELADLINKIGPSISPTLRT